MDCGRLSKAGRRGAIGAALLLAAVGVQPAWAGGCCGGGEGGHGGHGTPVAEPKGAKSDAEVIREQLPTYPLKTCVVSGEALGGEMGDPIDYVHEGRLVRFCCKSCIKDFKKDPKKYLDKLDQAAKGGKEEGKKDEGGHHGDHGGHER